MRFYNREDELKELKTLSKASEKKAVMCVITGVRRVGKTELIKQFFKQEDGLYFFVDSSKTSTQLLEEFSRELKEKLNISERLAINSWDEFFEELFDHSREKKLIIAFDEFQRFSWINKSLPFTLQKHFDLNKNNSKSFIIISGSSFGLLKKMFIEQNAPLFQRPSNIFHLRQFDFKTIYEILNDLKVKNLKDKIEFYALFGGIPKYYDLIESYNIKNANNAMKELIFSSQASLRREVKNIIMEEFGRETTTYYSILCAVAFGKNKANEISDYSGIKETSLSPYLYDLTELLGAIKRELPVTEDIKSKKARYYLDNNFFKLWFKFVYRNKSDFELGRFEGLLEQFKQEKNSFIGFAFEEVCKQYLMKKIKFDKIGKWWGKGNKESIEIDLVALDEKQNTATFVECKWQERHPTIADLEKLKEKSKFVQWNRKTRSERFIFFSKSGFDGKTLEYGKTNGLVLIDLKELEAVFK